MKESGRLAPNSYYAVAKAAQTHLASLIAQRDGLAALTFRLFSVYGPWEEPTRLIPTLLRRAWNGLPLEMASPATARDFVYLDDVLALLLDFPRLAQATPGGVYNVGSGKQTMLADLVPLVCTVTRATPEVRWRSMAARHWDTTTWCAEPGLTHRTFGWSPQHSLVDGLAATLAWLEHRGDLSHARLPCRNVA
jgi:dolichol-phosphate mannosyltransferase